MHPSPELISRFKEVVVKASNDPSFIHHPWFVTYHLEIVVRLADELCRYYPAANRERVEVLAWLHDYGKALDFDRQYELTPVEGRKRLTELGFDKEFVDTVIEDVQILDKKLELDLHGAPIEVRIVSSADGCSHYVGPFLKLWWWEHPGKPFEELMADNRAKADKDWNHKIVLPEARQAFAARRAFILEQCGDIPETFLE